MNLGYTFARVLTLLIIFFCLHLCIILNFFHFKKRKRKLIVFTNTGVFRNNSEKKNFFVIFKFRLMKIPCKVHQFVLFLHLILLNFLPIFYAFHSITHFNQSKTFIIHFLFDSESFLISFNYQFCSMPVDSLNFLFIFLVLYTKKSTCKTRKLR